QSIGAGGGLGVALAPGSGMALNVGGRQSADASHVQDGGKVRLYGSKTILTDGADAHGVVLQSIGAGGGVGGMTLPADGGSVAGAIVLGGTGDGNGQTVTVDDAVLRIGTQGDRAVGLVAQSIGGGGGIAGAGAAGGLSGVSVGGQGDAIAHGGDVSVRLAGGSLIQTAGRGAHGMVAQSIGGGGGIAGDLGGAPLAVGAAGPDGGTAGGGGDGGVVTIDVNADIVTTGDNAFGILAQSIGGGGGLSGDASAVSAGPAQGGRTGSGGLIHLAQSGRVQATGRDSVGIFAQSQGPTADGGMDLTIMGDVVGGTGEQGAGVWLVGGNKNWLAVQAGASVTAGSGVAIRYDGTRSVYEGSETTVQNYGTIAGDILLHAPDSVSAGTINNLGAITPAAAGRAGTPAQGGVLVGARRYDA